MQKQAEHPHQHAVKKIETATAVRIRKMHKCRALAELGVTSIPLILSQQVGGSCPVHVSVVSYKQERDGTVFTISYSKE